MSGNGVSEAAKAVVRRNTDEVQSKGNFNLFEELFADDFVDHTPQPGGTPDKSGARKLYRALRAAFPDFHATIHWQTADGDVVTTFKTYHGTHKGSFLGIPATDRKIQFETVRCHACPERQDHSALGRREFVFRHATARRVPRATALASRTSAASPP